MSIVNNLSLKPYNSFNIDHKAQHFTVCNSIDNLKYILSETPPSTPILVLGGGSNILFTKDFTGLVIKNEIAGIEIIREDEQYYYIKAGSGVQWHDFVLYCIKNNYAGIENLSLIPGTVGASPIQNIGAYGVEIKDVFEELTALNLETKELLTFRHEECRFGYRDSIFKQEWKNKLFILDVTFRLNKVPVYRTSYGDIESYLKQMNVKEYSIKAISDAVIAIRSAKLPDPEVTGNAGSFFKNPVVDETIFNKVYLTNNTMPFYRQGVNYKIPAAWLIEQCGWKGKTIGNVGCHAKQPLVLINLGNANGKDVLALSQEIIDSVNASFGIVLEREVNVL